jgi:hypothetical protein
VSITFGDGTGARGRARVVHRYAHAGIYRVIVHVRDKIGNRGVVGQWVSAQ